MLVNPVKVCLSQVYLITQYINGNFISFEYNCVTI